MKDLIIIGAGGFAREVYWLALTINRLGCRDWQIKGFLDNRQHLLDGYTYPHPIISSVEQYDIQENDVFASGVGNPVHRQHYCEMILKKGGHFINLIHPMASISNNISWGSGVVVAAYSAISCDVKIGNFVAINSYVQIGHDVVIGDFSQINSLVFLGGFSEIGRSVIIHPHAIIVPKVKIEDNVTVGAGSVVLKNTMPNQTIFGMPAMPIEV